MFGGFEIGGRSVECFVVNPHVFYLYSTGTEREKEWTECKCFILIMQKDRES